MRPIYDTLFRQKPARFLLCVLENENPSGATIQRNIDSDHNRVYILRNKLENFGLIWSYKEGRCVKVRLTDKGRVVAQRLAMIRHTLNGCGVKNC